MSSNNQDLEIIVQTPKDIIDKLNTILGWKKNIIDTLKYIPQMSVPDDISLEALYTTLTSTQPPYSTFIVQPTIFFQDATEGATISVQNVEANCQINIDGKITKLPKSKSRFISNLPCELGRNYYPGEKIIVKMESMYGQEIQKQEIQVTSSR